MENDAGVKDRLEEASQKRKRELEDRIDKADLRNSPKTVFLIRVVRTFKIAMLVVTAFVLTGFGIVLFSRGDRTCKNKTIDTCYTILYLHIAYFFVGVDWIFLIQRDVGITNDPIPTTRIWCGTYVAFVFGVLTLV